ncbi:MAG: DUF805 domain-containing protein [Moraxella sp.]|nr:DUF805 domain-containing protein [Moraxella sp.]
MRYQDRPERLNLNPYHTPESTFDEWYEEYEYDTTPFYKASGRIGRLRYLAYSMTYAICCMLVMMAVVMLTMLFLGANDLTITVMMVIYFVMMTINIYGMFALAIRRLNDINKSGWFSLLFLLPFANLALMLYLLFARGNDYVNDYGAPAMPASTRVKILAFIVPLFFMTLGMLMAIAIPAYQDYVIRAQMAQIG